MFRSGAFALMVSFVLLPAAAARASDSAEPAVVAPSKAVAEAWAREERTAPSSPALNALHVSYAGLQGLDVWSTFSARRNGAREVNPLMTGGAGTSAAIKAALSVGTIVATQAMAKKNRKAAVITMWVVNGVTAAVVANNVRNARR